MLAAMASCQKIEKIVIDTDSPLIKQECAQHFPDVVVLDRPQHLLGDMTPMTDILLHDISQIESDFYLQTHSTNPLLTKGTLERAVDSFLAQYPIYDSLFSVTRVQARFWDGLARAINHNPNILLRTQDLPPVFEENSCIYIFESRTLRERHSRIGSRPIMFEIDRLEAQDIDEEIDFRIADLIFKEMHGGSR